MNTRKASTTTIHASTNCVSYALRSFAFAITIFAAGTNLLDAANDCDRVCLMTALDQYLNAVIKHDPATAPLFVGFRQTENAVVVSPVAGIWKTITALGTVQRRYIDPVSGQAGYFGTVQEGNDTAIVTLRLKVENSKINEAEWIIARKGDPGPGLPPNVTPAMAAQFGLPASGNPFAPDKLAASPPREKILPKEGRLSRQSLIAIANSYFDGLTMHDGSIIAAQPGCTRVENGLTTTGLGPAPNDCTSNLQTLNLQMVAARRYPIVDEEAGVVLGMGIFIRRPGSTAPRNLLSEWFIIENGQIRSIYAAMYLPAAEVLPNWPPYDGNWPLPSTVAVPANSIPR
jgi:hypothetical protein